MPSSRERQREIDLGFAILGLAWAELGDELGESPPPMTHRAIADVVGCTHEIVRRGEKSGLKRLRAVGNYRNQGEFCDE